MSRTITIKPGQIWVSHNLKTRTLTRRVIASMDDRVCYSVGSHQTRWCRRRAFRLWVRRYHAVATRTRRARTLVLKARRVA